VLSYGFCELCWKHVEVKVKEEVRVKVEDKQSRYIPGQFRGFQEIKFPVINDNGTGWW